MTLAKLNDDFGLEIHQDDLEGLTTDVYLEIDDEFGKGKGPLVFNPEYAINLIDWLRKNSEPIKDMVEGFTDGHSVADKMVIAEGLAKLVVWKLIPSKRLKVKEMINPIVPSLGNVVAGQILNDQNIDKEKEKRKHPNSEKDDVDLAELDHNGDGWLKYCRDKKKKESNILTFEEIYSLR